MRYLFIIFFIISFKSAYCQCKKTIEEIALYHLHSMTQNGQPLVKFKYFTNGYLEKDSLDFHPILYHKKFKYSSDTILRRNPFENCIIQDKKNYNKISVPSSLRHEKTNFTLNIYHFKKETNKYYILFSQETNTDLGGNDVIVVINLNGDLINYGYTGQLE